MIYDKMSLNQGVKDWGYDKMSHRLIVSNNIMPAWACALAGIFGGGI